MHTLTILHAYEINAVFRLWGQPAVDLIWGRHSLVDMLRVTLFHHCGPVSLKRWADHVQQVNQRVVTCLKVWTRLWIEFLFSGPKINSETIQLPNRCSLGGYKIGDLLPDPYIQQELPSQATGC